MILLLRKLKRDKFVAGCPLFRGFYWIETYNIILIYVLDFLNCPSYRKCSLLRGVR